MLIEVIRKTLFAGDSLGKWSDNEYIIMVEETKNNNRVNDVIQNILLNINKPLILVLVSILKMAIILEVY